VAEGRISRLSSWRVFAEWKLPAQIRPLCPVETCHSVDDLILIRGQLFAMAGKMFGQLAASSVWTCQAPDAQVQSKVIVRWRVVPAHYLRDGDLLFVQNWPLRLRLSTALPQYARFDVVLLVREELRPFPQRTGNSPRSYSHRGGYSSTSCCTWFRRPNTSNGFSNKPPPCISFTIDNILADGASFRSRNRSVR